MEVGVQCHIVLIYVHVYTSATFSEFNATSSQEFNATSSPSLLIIFFFIHIVLDIHGSVRVVSLISTKKKALTGIVQI